MRAMRARGFNGYGDLELVDLPKPQLSNWNSSGTSANREANRRSFRKKGGVGISHSRSHRQSATSWAQLRGALSGADAASTGTALSGTALSGGANAGGGGTSFGVTTRAGVTGGGASAVTSWMNATAEPGMLSCGWPGRKA